MTQDQEIMAKHQEVKRMAKFKALITFDGYQENKRFKANEEFEMTVARSKEIEKNIKENYGIEKVMERVDNTNGEEKNENKKEE